MVYGTYEQAMPLRLPVNERIFRHKYMEGENCAILQLILDGKCICCIHSFLRMREVEKYRGRKKDNLGSKISRCFILV